MNTAFHGPAERAGIRPNDTIISIDGIRNLAERPISEIGALLTGESGNKIINFQDYNAQTIGIILLWLSAFLTLYTGYDYLVKGIDHAINKDRNN